MDGSWKKLQTRGAGALAVIGFWLDDHHSAN
jgi:hypothetical protein